METPQQTLAEYRAKKTAAFMAALAKHGMRPDDTVPLELAAEELVASVVADMTIHNSHPEE